MRQVLVAKTKIILVSTSRGCSADDPRQYLKSAPTGPSPDSALGTVCSYYVPTGTVCTGGLCACMPVNVRVCLLTVFCWEAIAALALTPLSAQVVRSFQTICFHSRCTWPLFAP